MKRGWRPRETRAQEKRATELRALARALPNRTATSSGRPSLGPSLPPGRVAASAAGAAPYRAPAALSYGEKPPRSEVKRLVDRGYTDARIGAIYRRTDAWANLLRKEYGIAAVRPENRLQADPLGKIPTVQPELADAALAAFHAIAGPYPSYTEAQIRRFERQCAVAMGAPRAVNVTRELCGDPAPR